jgi:hypothetical protein
MALAAVCALPVWSAGTPVTQGHIKAINDGFVLHSILAGYVDFDSKGRVELMGLYEDNGQVDLAFSIAQTVVGVRWVSPVTPENIKVKEWEQKLSGLFSKRRTPSPAPGPPMTGMREAPGPVARRYAVVVGVGRFQNPKITPLQYAARDAQTYYEYLVDPRRGGFPRQNVTLLLNEDGTRANIKAALDNIKAVATEDDLVTIYFSSHGTPPDKFGGVHVVTYDTQVEPRQRVWATALSEDILKDFIQNLRSKRLIVVMDACYSNGAYRQIAGFLPPGGKSLGATEDEGFGISRQYMSQRLLGAKDLVLDEAPAAPPPPRATAAKDLAASEWGKVLISASDSGERSWESDTLKNGYFTRYFVDGLGQSRGRVKDSFQYAKPMVRTSVKKEKGDDIEQNPQIVTNRKEYNMSLAAQGAR